MDHPIEMFHCNWNWCPEAFRRHDDLMVHLDEHHFKAILKIKKRDWDAYLRSTEGCSGATDSLMAAIPSYSSSISRSTPNPLLPSTYENADYPTKSLKHALLSATPPLVPSFPSTAPSSSFPPGKRRRISFASYTAQSSPMSTSSASSLPPSPALSNMLADVINKSTRIIAVSPSRPSSSNNSSRSFRRTSVGESAAPGSSRGDTITLPPSWPAASPPSRTSSSPRQRGGEASPASSQAVEDVLTQVRVSSPFSREGSWTDEAEQVSGKAGEYNTQIISSSYQPAETQDSLMYQHQSFYGSHAVDSLPSSSGVSSEHNVDSSPRPDRVPEQSQEHVRDVSPRPIALPRRRTRSNTPSVTAVEPPVTRALHSRSKTPAAASIQQSKSLPPPRRTTRSRSCTPSVAVSGADAVSNANSKLTKRATSKPGSARRGASMEPGSIRSAAARKDTAGCAHPYTGGLTPVVEQADDSTRPEHGTTSQTQMQSIANNSESQSQSQVPTSGSQSGFRSGLLELPRSTRTRTCTAGTISQSQSQPQPQSQA